MFVCKFLANEADREKIALARKILLQHISEPLTIRELSRKAAINEFNRKSEESENEFTHSDQWYFIDLIFVFSEKDNLFKILYSTISNDDFFLGKVYGNRGKSQVIDWWIESMEEELRWYILNKKLFGGCRIASNPEINSGNSILCMKQAVFNR